MIDCIGHHIFKNSISTLKETSKDNSQKEIVEFMTLRNDEVVNFDYVKRLYTNSLNHSENAAKSVDALVPFDKHIAFIEFKNGDFKDARKEILEKVLTSLLIFCDVTDKTVTFTRKDFICIIVYNEDHVKNSKMFSKNHLFEKANDLEIEVFLTNKIYNKISLYFEKVYLFNKKGFEQYLKRNPIKTLSP